MKKIITILFVLVMVSSIVVAQGNAPKKPDDAGKNVDAGQPENVGQPTLINAKQDGESNLTEKPELKGIENALTQVTNENARARLEANLAKIQARIAEKIAKREAKMAEKGEDYSEKTEVEIEEVDEESGDVVVKAKEPVKYLGFIKGKATKRYSVNAEGKIQEKAPWYGFLYSE